uniref:ATP synthase F0 subunit 8 n=1 Tax=Caryophyllia scobinosa TaxID=691193 RepID=UPI002176C442|nr:ATP synthase F0 subunit 8 [Caryophyllia scobinosa]UUF92255.1 ATP synthase subunit 8 [Caryophyllia scobinosa]
MPQLDTQVFCYQYGSLGVVFFCLLFVFIYFVLPKIKASFFFRKKIKGIFTGSNDK